VSEFILFPECLLSDYEIQSSRTLKNQQIRKSYPQENAKDPLIIVKLFDLCSSATWHLTENDPVEKIGGGWIWLHRATRSRL